MQKDFRRQLLTYLDTGHRHASMTDMMKCSGICAKKFAKGKAFYERMQKEKPELFVYKEPEFEPSQETKNMFALLMDRIKKDGTYRKHLEKLAHGTESEKDEEIRKSNAGYYRTHGI